MELEINEGVTLVYQHESKDYVVVHTKEVHLEEIMRQLRGFLLASGFSEKSINEYIALE
jgi:hypothetical protein